MDGVVSKLEFFKPINIIFLTSLTNWPISSAG